MRIIPDDLPEANRDLAERLAAGTYDPPDQAAVAVLLRMPALLGRADITQHIAGYEIEADDDRIVQAASVVWSRLAAQVDDGTIPATTVEAAGVQVAALLAGALGDALTSLDVGMRRAVVEAVAHAAGVDLTAVAAPGDDSGVVAALAAAVDGHPIAGRLEPCTPPCTCAPGVPAGVRHDTPCPVSDGLRRRCTYGLGHDGPCSWVPAANDTRMGEPR